MTLTKRKSTQRNCTNIFMLLNVLGVYPFLRGRGGGCINYFFSFLLIVLNGMSVNDSTFGVLPKELSFCHKLYFSNLYIFATQCRMTFDISNYEFCLSLNNLSVKYQRFTSLDCKDTGIRQFEFVTKTQFLSIFF